MQIKLAKKYGFCFGVKRAIKLAEKSPGAITFGPLIHNPREIKRLEDGFGVRIENKTENVFEGQSVIIRTHGITKQDLEILKSKNTKITDATCPFVIKPQQIAESMSKEGYCIVIFGDASHPEIQGVMSYAVSEPIVVNTLEGLYDKTLGKKVALISQTTKQMKKFLEIANYLMQNCYETRIFNTICNATFDNQEAVKELSQEVDIMIVVGGKTSSNTKQLLTIAQMYCKDSYLVEDERDLKMQWFAGKKICGITAGASTPDWIIERVQDKIAQI
ncbi:4-hydroxy-3-methylbut-2-enyl diphosphate reductase [Helicobacter mustelae]|uniref:4-hydroxy-3-methylbut-2-enyl diphosphate reductase n=1 Tax=Helicobacter mustelae (strain ATCC 43772 / CCUG 25715 / CIP 103759 / LMG 18044 / NCTC 12198 / R85-136P) TaxID=679897 RepID=D3UFQ0_HELM1|nr:4-hydroxy-3-methylbut-2-enyl diphosphate reductase [Helicobacter mustelae]CBG39321.1 4-hydroxy-3-methylbut-2-enyl diphosphate reductase LytB [Helicobacter mustelae 12198]SQH70833.1 4-hydroxy-3-methylbut-2-enyl diphosphate reductase [Helicobacter mustelae]STP11959.1 4-hydroxy-3-methylbut-2-enyl diphosphate reductase [Helicobacter mustelae]